MRMSSSSIGRMYFGSCTPFRSGLRNGPSRWMPSRPGTPPRETVAHRLDRLRHLLARIGDEGRQEAGGAEAAMRGADGADALDAARVVEEHAAAAVHLHVDEARREQPLDRAALDAVRRVADRQDDGLDAAVLDHDGMVRRASARRRRSARRRSRRPSERLRHLLQVRRRVGIASARPRQPLRPADRSSGSARSASTNGLSAGIARQREAAAARRRPRGDHRHAARDEHRDQVGDALIGLVVLAEDQHGKIRARRASAARASAPPRTAPRRGCRRSPSASAPPPARAPARCRGRRRRGSLAPASSGSAACQSSAAARSRSSGSRSSASSSSRSSAQCAASCRIAASERCRISSPRRSAPARHAAAASISQISASGEADVVDEARPSARRRRAPLRPDAGCRGCGRTARPRRTARPSCCGAAA